MRIQTPHLLKDSFMKTNEERQHILGSVSVLKQHNIDIENVENQFDYLYRIGKDIYSILENYNSDKIIYRKKISPTAEIDDILWLDETLLTVSFKIRVPPEDENDASGSIGQLKRKIFNLFIKDNHPINKVEVELYLM